MVAVERRRHGAARARCACTARERPRQPAKASRSTARNCCAADRTSSKSDGWELGAIYHSHIRTAPYPSQTDINFAANWPGVEWIIVGLAGERAGGALLPDRGAATSGGGHRWSRRCERASRSCARAARARIPPSERFCEDCGMPLVHAAGARAPGRQRAPAQGAQDQAPVRRRRAREGRPRRRTSPRPSSSRAAARGGHPVHAAPLRRLRRRRTSWRPGRATCSCRSPARRRRAKRSPASATLDAGVARPGRAGRRLRW